MIWEYTYLYTQLYNFVLHLQKSEERNKNKRICSNYFINKWWWPSLLIILLHNTQNELMKKKKKKIIQRYTQKKKLINWQYMMFKKWNKSNNYYGFACVIQNWYTTMLGNLTWFIVHIYIYTHIIYLFKEAT